MKRKAVAGILALTLLAACVMGCGSDSNNNSTKSVKLDPDNPV